MIPKTPVLKILTLLYFKLYWLYYISSYTNLGDPTRVFAFLYLWLTFNRKFYWPFITEGFEIGNLSWVAQYKLLRTRGIYPSDSKCSEILTACRTVKIFWLFEFVNGNNKFWISKGNRNWLLQGNQFSVTFWVLFSIHSFRPWD